MEHIESIDLATLGIIIALAGVGFFVTIGLAVIGALVVLGACGALAALIASFFAKRDGDTQVVA